MIRFRPIDDGVLEGRGAPVRIPQLDIGSGIEQEIYGARPFVADRPVRGRRVSSASCAGSGSSVKSERTLAMLPVEIAP